MGTFLPLYFSLIEAARQPGRGQRDQELPQAVATALVDPSDPSTLCACLCLWSRCHIRL